MTSSPSFQETSTVGWALQPSRPGLGLLSCPEASDCRENDKRQTTRQLLSCLAKLYFWYQDCSYASTIRALFNQVRSIGIPSIRQGRNKYIKVEPHSPERALRLLSYGESVCAQRCTALPLASRQGRFGKLCGPGREITRALHLTRQLI